MCVRCRELGMRAWHAIGADSFPAMTPGELSEFLDAESRRTVENLKEDQRIVAGVIALTNKIAATFGKSSDEAFGGLPGVTPVPPIEEVRAILSGLTAEFWTEHGQVDSAAAWITEHHPSGLYLGVPFDMLPEPVRERATTVAVSALYDREIARRIARQLPPLPNIGKLAGVDDLH